MPDVGVESLHNSQKYWIWYWRSLALKNSEKMPLRLIFACRTNLHIGVFLHVRSRVWLEYIYNYYPLYTNWPITNADFPHVIIQYIPYFICKKLYWTVSGQLSNIGYIGQFQNEATGTLRTQYRRTKAVSMYLMKILSIFLHLRKILICFRIGWFL